MDVDVDADATLLLDQSTDGKRRPLARPLLSRPTRIVIGGFSSDALLDDDDDDAAQLQRE